MTAWSYADNVIGTIKATRAIPNYKAVSGYTAAKYDILVRRTGITDGGASYAERSAWSLAGYTDNNTVNIVTSGISKQVLYLRITGTSTAIIKLYKATGGGSGDEVATGTLTDRAGGGAQALVESNSSGLTGSVTLAAGCTNVTDAIIYLEDYHDRYDNDLDATAKNIIGIYYPIDSDTTTIKTVVEEADNVEIRRLGYDNCDGEFMLSTLNDNLALKNIRVI